MVPLPVDRHVLFDGNLVQCNWKNLIYIKATFLGKDSALLIVNFNTTNVQKVKHEIKYGDIV